MSALDKVSSSLPLPVAARSSAPTEQDKILEDLMNEFAAEQAEARPASPPLGTTHAVEQIPQEDILARSLESFSLEQTMELQAKFINLQVETFNAFFDTLLTQPEDSLAGWLEKQNKEMVQAIFFSCKHYKTQFENSADLRQSVPTKLLKEWTVNYPLALLRIQGQPKLQGYIPSALEEQELVTKCFSALQGAAPQTTLKASYEKIIIFTTKFFETFLAIKNDEEAKKWLTEQRNKKETQDQEGYIYPFSLSRQITLSFIAQPDLKGVLDRELLNKWLTLNESCTQKVQDLGMADVLLEVDPQTQENLRSQFALIITFFKDLLAQLGKEPADPQRIKKWIDGHVAFKSCSPFYMAKMLILKGNKPIPSELHPMADEFANLCKKCVPLLKSMGLESYLKADPKSPPLGLPPEEVEEYNSKEL